MKRFALAALLLFTAGAFAAGKGSIAFSDPSGDDNGPGEYVYPTDAVYAPGSFDMTGVEIDYSERRVNFTVDFDSRMEDPWGMGTGFAVQMVLIFIDTDGKAGSGYSEGLPGLNIAFAEGHEWDKVVILSPQEKSRVTSEADMKAEAMKDDILVPTRTRGKGKSISGSISTKDLGDGDPSTWGYQVVVQSNEGFPTDEDLLTRRVNEFEGQHRFGGGNDGMCDPHVMDLLAGSASGAASEVEAQHQMLQYECDAEGNPKKLATLTMIRK